MLLFLNTFFTFLAQSAMHQIMTLVLFLELALKSSHSTLLEDLMAKVIVRVIVFHVY